MVSELTADELTRLNETFAQQPPQALLDWAVRQFGARVALASSFGAEDVALIDMLWSTHPTARVFMLDTLRLHTETYGTVDAIRQRYRGRVEAYYPDLDAVHRMTVDAGHNCFYASVDLRKFCCGVRKVEPLSRALDGLDAWITGLRRDQAATRTDTNLIEFDDAHPGLLKLNPLADWSSDQVWSYLREHDVPYNPLHDQGFPSIGCAPCTRAVGPGEDPRAGRWWWELDPDGKECGIHVAYDEAGVPRIVRGADH